MYCIGFLVFYGFSGVGAYSLVWMCIVSGFSGPDEARVNLVRGMNTQIMLICCYGNVNAAINLQAPFRFHDMVNCACEKFPGLTPAQVCLFFKIPGYNNLILHNDVDVENMVSLARSFRLQCIDIIIQLQESRDADNVGSPVHSLQTVPYHTAEVFDDSDMDDKQDLLEKFYPHIDKVFLFAPWANGIQHVGQSFEGAASEFRNVLRNEHICGVAVRTPKNPRAGSNLVSDVICERVHDKPLTRPTDVVYDLKKDYGLEVSYRVAWLGVEKARSEMFGAHSISFDQLRWYSSVAMENNLGSYINIEYDEQNYRFIRYFMSFKACIDGFNHYRPLLFLDGTFLKGKFKGSLLAATANDGNQDRHAGLLESIPIIFPTAKHVFCLQHLQRNLQDKLRYVNSSYRSVMLAKFRACAYAPTVAAFNQSMEEFTKCGHKITKRRRKANAWAGVICPKMEAQLVKVYNKGRSWLVSQSNDDVYEVHSFPSVMVDVGRRTCSCFKWQINDFPCAHAVVAIRNSGLDLYELVIPYYHVAEYQNSYAQNIIPIPTVEKPQFNSADFVIQPPVVKRPPGRPKKKRMLSKGEQVQQIRCGRCQRMGNHNEKTCKEPI
ncbi:hypothetical protein ACSBR1_008019 [Camellia fascicularis]